MILPDLSTGAYYVEMLVSAGVCLQTPSGPQPLTYQEIDSWSRVSRLQIEGHEAELLKQLSAEYCSHWYEARSPNMPDPDGSKIDTGKAFTDLLKRLQDD